MKPRKSVINLLSILLSLYGFAQTEIEGTYFKKYKLKDFTTSYLFSDSTFKYEHKGHTGLISYGEGTYHIKNDSLILNYNLTKSRNASYYKILSTSPATNDSIKLKFVIKNKYLEFKHPFNAHIQVNNAPYTQLNKEGALTLKKTQDSISLRTGVLHQDNVEFKIKANKNYFIEVFLSEASGKPIFNSIEKYNILKISKDSIELTNPHRKITLLKVKPTRTTTN